MSLQIGIVGLPNAGKSTLFNALTESSKAGAENFPFCTIDPNVGKVPVRDERLDKIAETVKTQKTIYETVEFVDIAGLVEGASKGEGLGNQFLAHIRETDAICLVLRFFGDSNVTHVMGSHDPKRDKEILETELVLKDLETAEKALQKAKNDTKTGDKEKIAIAEAIEQVYQVLSDGKKANTVQFDDEKQEKAINQLFLITRKPFLYVANVAEDEVASFDIDQARKALDLNEKEGLIPISAKIESEIALLIGEERKEFLESIGLQKSGLERLIQESYKILGLISYFTAGEKEARAWAVEINSTAPQSAGKIHTDFEKGFIKADCVGWENFISANGWQGAREKGLVQSVGKDYIVQDGDILLFKFNV